MSKWLCSIKELQTEGSRDSIVCRIRTLSSKIAILTMVTRTGPDYALDRIFGSEFSSPIFSVHGPFFLVRIIIFWPGSLTGPKKSDQRLWSIVRTQKSGPHTRLKNWDQKIQTRDRTTILTIKMTHFQWVNNLNFSGPLSVDTQW